MIWKNSHLPLAILMDEDLVVWLKKGIPLTSDSTWLGLGHDSGSDLTRRMDSLTAWQIKSLDGFVFFRLGFFDCCAWQQLFAIFIFEVDFLETYRMTRADNSVSEPPNLNIFWRRIPPDPR